MAIAILWFKMAIWITLDSPVELHQPRLVKKSGLVSKYYAWRKSATVPYARYAGAWRKTPTPRDLVCAHRRLPFGSILRLEYRGQSSICIVLDRGPFGACVPSIRVVKVPQCPRGFRYEVITDRRKMPSGGFYRGEIDATPAVHSLMSSKGWIWARIEKVGVARFRRALRLLD